MCVAVDDIKVIVHFLNREILVILVWTNSNNNKYIVGDYYMLLPDTIRNTRICNICLKKDNTICHLKDRSKEDKRIYSTKYLNLI